MTDEKPRRVYQTGDFKAFCLGTHFDVEYWYNPWSGQVEAFVGVVYRGQDEAVECEDKYPVEEGPDIPTISYKELEDDGKFKVSFKMPKKNRFGYRLAAGIAVLPLIIGLLDLLFKPRRKGV